MHSIQNYIEHTNLSPVITSADIEKLIEEAKQFQFLGICVPPYWVKKAKRDIGNLPIILTTVIGFPLGYNRSEVKLQEIKSAIRENADELDVVINISAVKTGAYEWVKPEIAQFAQTIHEAEKILKVIIETAYLTEKEIKEMCKICADAGADFVKTSTGFAPSGAKLEDVVLMRSILPKEIGIKASGGIKTFAQAKAFIEAGADRLGTSAGIQIIQDSI